MNEATLARRAFLAAAVLALMAPAACAQPANGLDGGWSATLEAGGGRLRLVLHVTRTDAGLAATLDSLDQAAFGLPVDTIQLDGAALRLEMKRFAASYQGAWKADSGEFQGEWSQGPATLPLNWRRANAAAAIREEALSAADRDFLLTYLGQTRDALLKSIAGLSSAQWTFKESPSRWSIGECVEHLLMEERMLFPTVRDQIARVPLPEGQSRAGREQDEKIIRFMTDRSQKASAAESVQPRGTLPTPAAGAADFSKARQETMDWVRTTPADLRGHGIATPTLGFVDAYGYLVMLAAHTARHTAQIEEVKSAAYPR